MFANVILPYNKKVNYCTFNDDMLIKAIDNYLKINGVRKHYHQYPTYWFHYARSRRFERICGTESFKLIERTFAQIYHCALKRKIVSGHRAFSGILNDPDVYAASVRECINYMVVVPPVNFASSEPAEPKLINVADAYSECYKAFMDWYDDFRSITDNTTNYLGLSTIARTVNVIRHITETGGSAVDIPSIVSTTFYTTYWRTICVINMLSAMMCIGDVPTKAHTSSESVETNDVEEEEEDNDDET